MQLAKKNSKDKGLIKDKGWMRTTACYMLVRDDLFRIGYSQPLLKCVTSKQAEYIIGSYIKVFADTTPEQEPHQCEY